MALPGAMLLVVSATLFDAIAPACHRGRGTRICRRQLIYLLTRLLAMIYGFIICRDDTYKGAAYRAVNAKAPRLRS